MMGRMARPSKRTLIEARDAGMTTDEMAEKFGVSSATTVASWFRFYGIRGWTRICKGCGTRWNTSVHHHQNCDACRARTRNNSGKKINDPAEAQQIDLYWLSKPMGNTDRLCARGVTFEVSDG